MTQNSRRRSGSKPYDVELRKSEIAERERKRREAEEAAARTPEQKALFTQQLRELNRLVEEGASRKQMTEARKRWAQERELLEEG